MKFVSRMKSTLVSLNTTAQKIHEEMNRNSEMFRPDMAEAENNKLQIQLNNAVAAARDEIDAIHTQAKAAVKEWATPAGDRIDTSDLELLKGGFQLSRKDIETLLVKHQGSGTMVNAIAKYAKEHSIGFADSYIPNVEDKLFVYESFAKSAHTLVSDIAHSIGIGDNAISLKMWAEPGNISQRAELVLYGLKVEEEPVPVPRGKGFNFNFKPLSGR